MEDAGFIIGSYVLTFATVGLLAWRYVRHGRKLATPGEAAELLALPRR